VPEGGGDICTHMCEPSGGIMGRPRRSESAESIKGKGHSPDCRLNVGPSKWDDRREEGRGAFQKKIELQGSQDFARG